MIRGQSSDSFIDVAGNLSFKLSMFFSPSKISFFWNFVDCSEDEV